MPLLDDLAAYIAAQGFGMVGVGIRTVRTPDVPDQVIVLKDAPGYPPDPVTTLERPGVRIVVRDAGDDAGLQTARNQAYALRKLLHQKVGLTLNGVAYRRIDCTVSEPAYVGTDSRGRAYYEVRFVVTKEAE